MYIIYSDLSLDHKRNTIEYNNLQGYIWIHNYGYDDNTQPEGHTKLLCRRLDEVATRSQGALPLNMSV